MGLIDGKIAFVTGAGSGIGREAALLLAKDGATVVLAGRRPEPLHALADEIAASGGRAVVRRLDVAAADDVRAAIAWTRDSVGAVDILVNAAGSASRVLNARFLSEAEWNATVAVNLNAVFHLAQAVLPDMLARGAGTIVTVSSLAALNPNLLGGAAYGAARGRAAGAGDGCPRAPRPCPARCAGCSARRSTNRPSSRR